MYYAFVHRPLPAPLRCAWIHRDGIDTGKVIKHGDDSAGICCKIAVTLEGEESTGILHEIHVNPYMRMVTTAEIVRNFSKSVNFKQGKEQNEDPSKNQPND